MLVNVFKLGIHIVLLGDIAYVGFIARLFGTYWVTVKY